MLTLIAIIIAVILFCSASSDWAAAKDWEASEYNEEMRHQELMDLYRSQHEEIKEEIRKASRFKGRRRSITDRNGNVLAEEILVSGEDEYDD